MTQPVKRKDLLSTSVAYLQKRDGTDKLLKILRYGVKWILATELLGHSKEAVTRLKSFDSSVGTSRKALRLGKFLQDVEALRTIPPVSTLDGFLELVANGCEGVYFFVEQFVWLVKAGALDKRHAPKLQKMSAWFELIGYFGSITLKARQIAALLHKESQLRTSAAETAIHQCSVQNGSSGSNISGSNPCQERFCDAGGGGGGADEPKAVCHEEELMAALRLLRFKRLLKTLSLVQDLADSLLALSDIVEEKHQPLLLRSPTVLATAGLLSALISTHKNWVSVRT